MKRRSKSFIAELHKLKDFCRKISREASAAGLEFDKEALYSWRLQVRNFELVILGMYNAGKTTLLNLLLSLAAKEDRLPTGIRPTTNKLWRISYNSKTVLKGMRIGESKPAFTWVADLENMLTRLESELNEASGTPVDYFELGLPVPWLKRTGWAVWDTPGKDDVDGLLDEAVLQNVLHRSEGAILATNYDQYKNALKYIEQLKALDVGCMVLSLTNSGKRPPEQFFRDAPIHLQGVRSHLRDHILPFSPMISIDSKAVQNAMVACAAACLTVERTIGQWRSGELSSGSPMNEAAAAIHQASTTIENGGLFQLWQALEAVEGIEESLMLMKAWQTVNATVSRILKLNDVRVENIASKENSIIGALERIDAKISLSLDAPDAATLTKVIIKEAEAGVDGKAQRARSRVEAMLNESISGSAPGAGVTFLRVVTFGLLGGNDRHDHEAFVASFLDRVWKYGEEFLSRSVWEFVSQVAIGSADEIAKQAASEFRTTVAAKQGWNYKFRLDSLSGDDLSRFAADSIAWLKETVGQRDFRTNDATRKRFLDGVQQRAKIISTKMAEHAAWWLREQMQEKLESYRLNTLKYLRDERNEIELELKKVRQSLESAVSVGSIIANLFNLSESALKAHLENIIDKHHEYATTYSPVDPS